MGKERGKREIEELNEDALRLGASAAPLAAEDKAENGDLCGIHESAKEARQTEEVKGREEGKRFETAPEYRHLPPFHRRILPPLHLPIPRREARGRTAP